MPVVDSQNDHEATSPMRDRGGKQNASPAKAVSWILQVPSVLNLRVAWRLLPLLVGALFTPGSHG
jgi:hypothetical protein